MKEKEAKFKIGENVWYLKDGVIGNLKIQGIKYHLDTHKDYLYGEDIMPLFDSGKNEKYYYIFNTKLMVEEKFCALTKEELLKSLEDGKN